VDAVVMVIDAGKGIEAQTRKLFEVCRQRSLPIFTFMNKLDRPARDPLALLDEVEHVLGIHAYPVNWPLGDGAEFRGLFDRQVNKVHVFERVPGGQFRAPVSVHGLSDSFVREQMTPAAHARMVEELAMLDGAGARFDHTAVLEGNLTPVFFGSAVNNFGVQLLLDAFLELAPPPAPRSALSPVPLSHRMGEGPGVGALGVKTAGLEAPSDISLSPSDGERVGVRGRLILPTDPLFSGFIFKIQANMDPKHRDRLAFVRICSGKFERDMAVFHTRTGKKLRLSSSHKLFGRERETVDEAYPGDVVGLVGHADFHIGDTLAEDPSLSYHEIPRFTPECFAWLHSPSTAQFKRFREGLEQLLQEGVVQSFLLKDAAQRVPLLGAVGPLQFEVVQYRLQTEYGAESRLEHASWKILRWATTEEDTPIDDSPLPTGARLAFDSAGKPVILFQDQWSCDFFAERNSSIRLSALPRQQQFIEAEAAA